ncbi:MAG: hypothetical protein H6797_03455 [Candidatus Nomurabacteria bacterium]|nr:MAG: hypothetical protein H6797_03455 [Candidatus Nomurabacteria bacterium]
MPAFTTFAFPHIHLPPEVFDWFSSHFWVTVTLIPMLIAITVGYIVLSNHLKD